MLTKFPTVNTSIIWGRRDAEVMSGCNLAYTLDNDTWLVYAGDHIHNLRDLQDTFKYIRIADGDTVELPSSTRFHGPMDVSPGTPR